MSSFLTHTHIPRTPKGAFLRAVEAIGPKAMASELGCSLTHVYRMGASKKTNGETRDDIFGQAKKAFKVLVVEGLKDAAFIVADSFVSIIGGTISFKNNCPDKDTFQEEIVDSMTAVSRLMRVCQAYLDGKVSKAQMRLWQTKAKRELDELVEKAIQEKTNK